MKDGGPAFPAVRFADSGEKGMSLRVWFAGQALKGLTTGTDLDLADLKGVRPDHERAAKFCYDAADAMIKEGEVRA